MTGAKLFLYDRSYFIVNQYLRRKRARKWIRIQPVCSNNPREHGAAGKDTHYTGIGGQGGEGVPRLLSYERFVRCSRSFTSSPRLVGDACTWRWCMGSGSTSGTSECVLFAEEVIKTT